MKRQNNQPNKIPMTNKYLLQDRSDNNGTQKQDSYGRMFYKLAQNACQINIVPDVVGQNQSLELQKKSTNESQNSLEICKNFSFDKSKIEKFNSEMRHIEIKIFGRPLTKFEQEFILKQQPNKVQSNSKFPLVQQLSNNKARKGSKASFQMQFQKSTNSMVSIFKKQQTQEKVFVNCWLDKQLDLLSKKLKNLWSGSAKFHPIMLVKIKNFQESSKEYYMEEYDLSNKKFLFTKNAINQLINFKIMKNETNTQENFSINFKKFLQNTLLKDYNNLQNFDDLAGAYLICPIDQVGFDQFCKENKEVIINNIIQQSFQYRDILNFYMTFENAIEVDYDSRIFMPSILDDQFQKKDLNFNKMTFVSSVLKSQSQQSVFETSNKNDFLNLNNENSQTDFRISNYLNSAYLNKEESIINESIKQRNKNCSKLQIEMSRKSQNLFSINSLDQEIHNEQKTNLNFIDLHEEEIFITDSQDKLVQSQNNKLQKDQNRCKKRKHSQMDKILKIKIPQSQKNIKKKQQKFSFIQQNSGSNLHKSPAFGRNSQLQSIRNLYTENKIQKNERNYQSFTHRINNLQLPLKSNSHFYQELSLKYIKDKYNKQTPSSLMNSFQKKPKIYIKQTSSFDSSKSSSQKSEDNYQSSQKNQLSKKISEKIIKQVSVSESCNENSLQIQSNKESPEKQKQQKSSVKNLFQNSIQSSFSDKIQKFSDQSSKNHILPLKKSEKKLFKRNQEIQLHNENFQQQNLKKSLNSVSLDNKKQQLNDDQDQQQTIMQQKQCLQSPKNLEELEMTAQENQSQKIKPTDLSEISSNKYLSLKSKIEVQPQKPDSQQISQQVTSLKSRDQLICNQEKKSRSSIQKNILQQSEQNLSENKNINNENEEIDQIIQNQNSPCSTSNFGLKLQQDSNKMKQDSQVIQQNLQNNECKLINQSYTQNFFVKESLLNKNNKEKENISSLKNIQEDLLQTDNNQNLFQDEKQISEKIKDQQQKIIYKKSQQILRSRKNIKRKILEKSRSEQHKQNECLKRKKIRSENFQTSIFERSSFNKELKKDLKAIFNELNLEEKIKSQIRKNKNNDFCNQRTIKKKKVSKKTREEKIDRKEKSLILEQKQNQQDPQYNFNINITFVFKESQKKDKVDLKKPLEDVKNQINEQNQSIKQKMQNLKKQKNIYKLKNQIQNKYPYLKQKENQTNKSTNISAQRQILPQISKVKRIQFSPRRFEIKKHVVNINKNFNEQMQKLQINEKKLKKVKLQKKSFRSKGTETVNYKKKYISPYDLKYSNQVLKQKYNMKVVTVEPEKILQNKNIYSMKYKVINLKKKKLAKKQNQI